MKHASTYAETICRHSKVVTFVQGQDGWDALSQYFENRLTEEIETDKRPTEPLESRINRNFVNFLTHFRPKANKIFISIIVIAVIVFLKISLTQGHENLVDSFKLLNKFS